MTGSGQIQAKDSEARAQVAYFGSLQGRRSLHPGRAKPKQELNAKQADLIQNTSQRSVLNFQFRTSQ